MWIWKWMNQRYQSFWKDNMQCKSLFKSLFCSWFWSQTLVLSIQLALATVQKECKQLSHFYEGVPYSFRMCLTFSFKGNVTSSVWKISFLLCRWLFPRAECFACRSRLSYEVSAITPLCKHRASQLVELPWARQPVWSSSPSSYGYKSQAFLNYCSKSFLIITWTCTLRVHTVKWMHPLLVFEYMNSQNYVMCFVGSVLLGPKLQILNQPCECNEAKIWYPYVLKSKFWVGSLSNG